MRGMSRLSSHLFALLGCTVLGSLAIATQSSQPVPDLPTDVKPIKVGAKLPGAIVANLDGKPFDLAKMTAGQPTVLVFYRGGWCPYCNTHLKELGQIQDELKGRGYQMVALSPDTPAELKKSLDKNEIEFTLLSDSKANAAKALGFAFRVDDKTVDLYKNSYKIDIERASGETHHILPVPAVIVVNKAGEVTFVHTDPDYRKRLSGADLLKAAK